MVQLDVHAVDVDGDGPGAGGVLGVATLHVVHDDVEVLVVQQVVGAVAHEVEAVAVEGEIVRVTGGRTPLGARVLRAGQSSALTRAARKKRI